jgi:hypothetical protein
MLHHRPVDPRRHVNAPGAHAPERYRSIIDVHVILERAHGW